MKRNTRSVTASVSVKAILPILLLALSYVAGGGKTVLSQGKCEIGQFKVTYYRNKKAQGTPATTPRCERVINHNWMDKGPTMGGTGDGKADGVPGEVLRDHFSARWVGLFQFEGGTYTFHAKADDGIRVWVDNKILIDQWNIHEAAEFSNRVVLSKAGHVVKVEYFENEGDAIVKVWWNRDP